MAGAIVCTGNAAADIAAIEASFAEGGITTVRGSIIAPTTRINLAVPANVPQRGTSRLVGGYYEVDGLNVSGRNTGITDIEMLAYGAGVRKDTAILFRLRDSYIASHGNAVELDTIAGSWIADNHFNALGSYATSGAAALAIGDTPLGYEAADVTGNLVERYYTAFRIGGTGNCVNLRFTGNRSDRPTSASYLFAPQGTAGVRNTLIDEYWINQGQYSIVLSVAETTGRIDRIDIGMGHVLGVTHPNVTVMGDLGRIDYRVHGAGLVVGPAEPG